MQKRAAPAKAPATAAAANSNNASQKHKHWHHQRDKKKQRATSSTSMFRRLVKALLLAGALAGGGFLAFREYQERYPKEQRCPPEDDRFHDHCKEGRKHYVLSLDWTCLGSRRAEAMRMALSLPSDGKPLKGVGEIPSWLTDENAEALRNAPCMKAMALDMACRYCTPSKRPTRDSNEALAAQAAAAQKKQEEEAGGKSGKGGEGGEDAASAASAASNGAKDAADGASTASAPVAGDEPLQG
jgi:hypothetical protein